jgi:hypothetical protein
MSASPGSPEDASGEEMADMADLPANQGTAGEDEQASTEQPADHHISDLLEEELQHSSEQPAEEDGLPNRYKEILQEEADAVSDNSSPDALPNRVGSPVDSVGAESPSVQVWCCP